MSTDTEAYWRRRVVALAHVEGWRVGTTSPPLSDPGFPDLVLTHPAGRLLFVELKSDTGALRAEQRRYLADLTKAGADVRVWRPRDEAAVRSELASDDTPTEQAPVRAPDLADVAVAVADLFRIPWAELAAPGRRPRVVRPRAVFVVLARELTTASYPTIAEAIGRTHATAIHAERLGRQMIESEEHVANIYSQAVRELSTVELPAHVANPIATSTR